MSRFFYKEPLAAAWQSKHFGMLFIDSFNDDITNDKFLMEAPMVWGVKCKFYIHPDSVHLLEPRDADLVDSIRFMYGWEMKEKGYGLIKIIQRNGIPFMWPEVEA